MNKLDAYSEGFKLGYEKFIIGCDSQEELKGWDVISDGEMEGYYSNILVTVIMKLIASDGIFSEKEVRYFNEMFGFEYSAEELKNVYENCADEIEADFCDEIEEAVDKLEEINKELAEAFKNLLGLVGDIVSASDGVVSDKETALIKLIEKHMD